jgi:hypothetical protein
MAKLHVSQYKAEPKLEEYIGKNVEEAINKIKDYYHCVPISDSIGLNGYRKIALMKLGRRFEIVCETNQAKDVLDKKVEALKAVWRVVDIFEYEVTSKNGIWY